MNMFKSTSAQTPEEYISLIAEPRKTEIQQLYDFIRTTLPQQKPFIQSGMISFGKFHYTYKSGREGDWMLIALASQKNYISVYVCSLSGDKYLAELYKDKLPKANIGKSCIRFKKIADIDLKILREILLTAEKNGGMMGV